MVSLSSTPRPGVQIQSFALQPSPPRWNSPTGASGAIGSGGAGAGGAGEEAGVAGARGSGNAGKVSWEFLPTHRKAS